MKRAKRVTGGKRPARSKVKRRQLPGPLVKFNEMIPRNNRLFRAIVLFVAVYFFIVSIQTMSAGFKSNKDISEGLIESTTNPLVALFIGILATSLIQSSSATTSIVVAMVAADPSFMPNAIPIVMGANIGTSVTNTLVSLGHMGRKMELERAFSAAVVHDIFNLMAVSILFPIEMITKFATGTGLLEGIASRAAGGMGGSGGFEYLSPLENSTKPVAEDILLWSGPHTWLAIVIGLAILFLSLKVLVDTLKWLAETKAQKVLEKYLFGKAYMAFGFGIGLTALVQSSSITTSFAVPLVGGGLLTVEQIFPFTLGANIGTTVTAMLAAMATAEEAAVTIAIVHLLFNLMGVAILYPFKRIPIGFAHRVGEYISDRPRFAIIYIVILFYIIPGLVILVSRLW